MAEATPFRPECAASPGPGAFADPATIAMADDLEQIRRTMPDLARLDPHSAEARAWLDDACRAVRQVDAAEGVIVCMHRRYLLDPAKKIVAGAEIAAAIDRAAKTSAVLKHFGVCGPLT